MGVPTRYKGRPLFNVRWIEINASAPSSFQLPYSAFCQDSKERRGQSSCSNIDREIREGMSSLYLAHVLSRSMRVVYVLSMSCLRLFSPASILSFLVAGRHSLIIFCTRCLTHKRNFIYTGLSKDKIDKFLLDEVKVSTLLFVSRSPGLHALLSFKTGWFVQRN